MKRPPVIIVQLIHIHGAMKGEIQEFSQDVISIGRNPLCDLHFPAELTIISRKHAEIIREGNQFRLIDYSANGTSVNGKAVKEIFLKAGDVIEFSEGGPKVSFLMQIKEISNEDESILPTGDESPEAKAEAQPSYAVEKKMEVKQKQEEAAEISIRNTIIPLVIQYGPSIRSFKQLPVIIGRSLKCNFVLDHPSIFDQHSQIFYFQDKYWIKDLTGQKMVMINNQPIESQASLNVNDCLSLSPQGPVFNFVGLGRLAEIEEPAVEKPVKALDKTDKFIKQTDAPDKEGIFSKIKKLL